MATVADLDRLKHAYKVWNDSKGTDTSVWLELVADSFRLQSVATTSPGLEFAGARTLKSELATYFAGIQASWTMVHWTPEVFLRDGDHIAVFGRCAYTNKATGKLAEILISGLWRFRDGKAIEMTEIFDSGRAMIAATAG